ncbi:MAG: type IV pilus twitching motility protein PilT [Candidatus Marinimicrobia bacterium]|jgi:twitching motility protein PilT|nr:type IV pilus twitching motility protein PilT [Candidatus Neomarinimicrobiota bacterium]MBT3634857.1 type IV pilus twitching motility protein PilT [Candidatus Neomarinimicrobiota bacterium]MBT3682781.1 type IV pilus twitching motility protein PilT [Candidatus Neomarinimicrobiota bacterium]MBT3759564.1 type IV pilus twitching motility protein PilT [Candidatus Neomarinimicrobiota bacterium]MBT3894564.1 type IV pilus twitching motility protein PilT [Candidatus Neomarinimicrobiota bacterium]
MDIYSLLTFMRDVDASDLHISPNSPPIFRVNGELIRTKMKPLTPENTHMLVYDLMNDEQRKNYEEELEVDFSSEFKGLGRFRVNIFTGYFGDTAVLRAISDEILDYDKLGLPEIVKDLVGRDKGLILITGPTGSGKTTTMTTLVSYINKKYRRHIITIEDPVEFIHQSEKSLINHREVGTNTHSFKKALRSALREDPDIIVVGEMRDLETTALAITAAETGHVVFGTLHTTSATQTIERVIDQYPPDQQSQIRLMISESLLLVISQVLLKKRDGGRVAAFEIMVGIPAVSNLIREAKTYQLSSILQTNANMGMITMEQSVTNLYNEEVIDKLEFDKYISKYNN